MFGVDVDRFLYVPFPMHRLETRSRSQVRKVSNRIMSSGRASCDWENLLEAVADLPQYQVLLVHGKKDLKRLGRVNIPNNCELLCDIPLIEHDRLLEESACYVISLLETQGSSGHVRLSHAIHLGVPVIVTATCGIEEYVIDAVTAIVVPPGDPEALKKAILRLMGDSVLQSALAENARRHAEKYPKTQYFERLNLCARKWQ